MSITTISIPRLNDELWDYMQLARIWQATVSAPPRSEVHFEFLGCDFLRPNAVVILGGLIRLLQGAGRIVRVHANTMRDSVQANLMQNGFLHAMGASCNPWRGNAIPYQEFTVADEERIVSSLRNDWLGRGWISVSDRLAYAIMGQVWELFINAFEHGQSPIGVICCGQHFPRRRELLLSIADFGVGIPANVRDFLQRDCHGGDAMMQAFHRGFSTAGSAMPRGMGLDLVKEFVQKTNGCLEIFSYDGHARVDAQGERYQNIGPIFAGTLVQIRLRCDDKFYLLSNELNEQPFF
ncbi:ATP-binding protein [Metapseudomonas boanensis]|uniref:ATP-binding protein n=1 Tax=Metapseudomonas boanensis TaxID=2822138 RepID=A0ABS5XIQ8_9GAMM|nr:ATP-binding protein [Pseudomonas boanensis]MBT8767562.1 ATP-binding protein [Pseudomonas boanensis]